MAPLDLVELLNSIFTAIDGVVEACAGVPEEAGVHKGAGRGRASACRVPACLLAPKLGGWLGARYVTDHMLVCS